MNLEKLKIDPSLRGGGRFFVSGRLYQRGPSRVGFGYGFRKARNLVEAVPPVLREPTASIFNVEIDRLKAAALQLAVRLGKTR
jgi:hypothetical protein